MHITDRPPMMTPLALPQLSLRAIAVWRRNFLVWRKLAIPSVMGNLADPMIYLFGLGYGLGSLMPGALPAFGGVPYIAFLAAGTLCSSAMNAASFEALYSGFSRMHVQKTWEAIVNAPLSMDDVVAGELLWAATKATVSGSAILFVALALGLVQATPAQVALAVLPAVFLTGLTFAAMGLVITALAPSYDFFMFYFTLLITPMTLLSGVFFPVSQLPAFLRAATDYLPLTHSVALVRPLLLGQPVTDPATHIAVLAGVGAVAYWAAAVLVRRRLLA